MLEIKGQEILDVIVGRIDPYIYAFRTNSVPDSLKVGDTLRGVNTRLDEWRHHYPNLVHMFEHVASIPESNLYFRDYAVHQYLENVKQRPRLERKDFGKGIPYSQEFFRKATVSDLKEAIADITDDAKKGREKYRFYDFAGLPQEQVINRSDEPWKLRDLQQDVVDKFIDAIDKKQRDNLLMYAVMRFGKTFTALSCAEAMRARLVVVVTAKADVLDEWKINTLTPKQFENFVFLTQKNMSGDDCIIQKKLDEGKTAVVFLTLQDLQGRKIKEKHSEIFRHSIDLLIVDETHFGARADEYGRVLRKSRDKNEDFGNLNILDDEDVEILKELPSKTRLHLSGTPYNIILGNEFTHDDIVAFCQYTDILKAKERWYTDNTGKDEWENPYYGFPQMIRFAFTPSKSALQLLESLKKENIKYDFSELFATKSTVKSPDDNAYRIFKHHDEVLELMQVIDGAKTDSNVLSFLDNSRIKNGEMCHHIVCVLPFRSSCDAMSQLLEDEKKSFRNLCDYEIINIAGHDTPFRHIANVKDHISKCEAEGKKTISFTVNRMLTGCTVPQWDTMIFLKNSHSAQEYDQASFRIQSQFINEYKDDAGNVIKKDMKPQTILVDFDPDRMFRVQERRSFVASVYGGDRGLDSVNKRIDDDLKFSPIITLNADKLHQVTPKDVFASVLEYSRMRSASEEALDLPVDYDLLEDEYIRNFVNAQKEIDAKKGWNERPHDDNDSTNYKDGNNTTEPSDNPGNNNTNNTGSDKEKPGKEKSIEKMFATLYVRILFFAYLTDSTVTSLDSLIKAATATTDNVRILKNVGLNTDILRLIAKKMDVYKLRGLDNSIYTVNHQIKDESIPLATRITNATRKFGRMSSFEIVTPPHIAREMIDLFPESLFMAEHPPKILDIASKQGEFAYAFYEKYGDIIKDSVYSITTSPLAYEFTRKIYKLLGFPVENVFEDFYSFDLIGKDQEKYIEKLKSMNLNITIGNPPYQKEGGSGGTNDAPIYQNFCDAAFKISSIYNSLIIPARWFSGGRENLLGAFRKQMLSSRNVKTLYAYPNGHEVFPAVEIKGGLCHFMIDMKHNGECTYILSRGNERDIENINLGAFDIMIREPKLRSIIEKIKKVNKGNKLGTVDKIISADTPFGIPTNPGKSSKNRFNVFAYSNESHNTTIYYLEGGKRTTAYVSRSEVKKNVQDIDKPKVFIPGAYGAGETFPHQILGMPELGMPNSVCSQTYLYASFNSLEETQNFIKYLKTKFFRAVVLSVKNAQHAMNGVYRFVPMQDFTSNSDIDWGQSVADINRQLYRKYNLSDDEIAFIESMIKPM